eukprot:scaffold342_cov106-Isochrysis_galbana.AAC.7
MHNEALWASPTSVKLGDAPCTTVRPCRLAACCPSCRTNRTYRAGHGSRVRSAAGAAQAYRIRATSQRRLVHAWRQRLVRARVQVRANTGDGCKDSNGRCVLHFQTDEKLLHTGGAPLPLTSHRLQGAHFSEVGGGGGVLQPGEQRAHPAHNKGRHPWGQVARTSSALLEVRACSARLLPCPLR